MRSRLPSGGTEMYAATEVFTPSARAKLNFVERALITDRLVTALQTPGKQVIVYGESGSGKSSLLEKKLEETYEAHITTRCTVTSTFNGILLDGFDKVAPFYRKERQTSLSGSVTRALEADFRVIKASVDSVAQNEIRETEVRALPPQLTAQRLGEFLGAQGVCWVLEDFHKVPPNEKAALSQALKVFSDLSGDFPHVRVVAVGAVETARMVVEYDREMAHRVAEILVPLMNPAELREIVDQGQRLLNVDFGELTDHFIQYSVGQASVTHQLALNACLDTGVRTTQPNMVRLDVSALQPALDRWLDEASDTTKAAFDLALRRETGTEYDNCRLILAALAKGPLAGMRHDEILAEIHREHSQYPAANLTRYLKELSGQRRGEIVRRTSDERFRYDDPFHHTFAQVTLLPPRTRAQEDELVQYIARYLDRAREREPGLADWLRELQKPSAPTD